MMLQTLVENAIKHGISKEKEGGLIKIISDFKKQPLRTYCAKYRKAGNRLQPRWLWYYKHHEPTEIIVWQQSLF